MTLLAILFVVIELPPVIETVPGSLVKIDAKTEQKYVEWEKSGGYLIPFPGEYSSSAIFSSPTPGEYTIFAWTVENNRPTKAAKCIVRVIHRPDPRPNPPNPQDNFQKIYDQEKNPEALKRLIGFYVATISALKVDATMTKVDHLVAYMRSIARPLGQDLIALRKEIAKELSTVLPQNTNTALDRELFIKAFQSLISRLEAIAK